MSVRSRSRSTICDRGCAVRLPLLIATAMNKQPEIVKVKSHRVSCDGATDIPGGAALGHPRVWLEIDERGYVECGYCDRRFVLAGGPADA